MAIFCLSRLVKRTHLMDPSSIVGSRRFILPILTLHSLREFCVDQWCTVARSSAIVE